MCPHLNDNLCELASWVANKPIETTPEICGACNRCSKPRDINEVVLSLCNIEATEDGPGTKLHKLITWFIPQPKGCDCPNRVKVMDLWGYERCLQELPTILSWLRESALDNNYPYSEFVIGTVVKQLLKSGLR
jgi:hypothetical protein